jgi:hypothetical protein
MIWPGHVAHWGDRIQGFVGKSRSKEQLGRNRSKWYHIKMNIREIVWGSLWTGFISLRNETSENSNEPSGSIKFREFLVQLSKFGLLMKDSAA